MNLSNFLVSYNRVAAPEYTPDTLEDVEDPIDNYLRAHEFNHTRQATLQATLKPTDKPFGWTDGIKGVTPEQPDNSPIPTSKNEVVNRMVNRMKLHGFTNTMIAGVLGNAGGESNFNVDITSKDGYGSKHLLQWTGSRLKELHRMYGEHPTVELQVDFMVHELNTTEKKAFNSLMHAKSKEQAVEAFMNDFERPNKRYANLIGRIQHMKQTTGKV